MLNSKLLQLYQSLSEEECIACAAFVRSSVFNQSKDVVRLWNFLQRQRKAQRINKLTKAQVFSFLFADAAYSDIKLRNLIRKLTKVIESFLIQHELQLNPIDREAFLNTIYRKRNLFDLFEKSGKRLAKILDQETERGSDYFLKQYHWRKQYYFHPRTVKDNKSVEQLQQVYQHLYYFQEIERLHIEVELSNQQGIYDVDYDSIFFKTVDSKYAAPILLKYAAQLLQTKDLNVYHTLKSLFYKNLKELDKGDRNVIYAGMLNFMILKMRENEDQFTKEALYLYKTGIDLGILISDKKLSGPTFYNITIASLKTGDFKWAKQFIDQYHSSISSEFASDYYLISQAYFSYYQGQLKKVITILSKYEFSQILLNLNAKSLLCRTYYELSLIDGSFFEVADNSILAFEKYMRRTKNIAPKKKQAYLNFIYALYKLHRLSNKKSAINTFKKQLENATNISNKLWLLKKIAERA